MAPIVGATEKKPSWISSVLSKIQGAAMAPLATAGDAISRNLPVVGAASDWLAGQTGMASRWTRDYYKKSMEDRLGRTVENHRAQHTDATNRAQSTQVVPDNFSLSKRMIYDAVRRGNGKISWEAQNPRNTTDIRPGATDGMVVRGSIDNPATVAHELGHRLQRILGRIGGYDYSKAMDGYGNNIRDTLLVEDDANTHGAAIASRYGIRSKDYFSSRTPAINTYVHGTQGRDAQHDLQRVQAVSTRSAESDIDKLRSIYERGVAKRMTGFDPNRPIASDTPRFRSRTWRYDSPRPSFVTGWRPDMNYYKNFTELPTKK